MMDLEVIESPDVAAVALDAVRTRLLAELGEPESAAGLASRLGVTRQKVNYHLRALEASGLVRVAEERHWGGLTERRMVATAASYVISPAALGAIAPDPGRDADRLSASYLIALAARAIREVGGLVRRARAHDKRLATLSIDTELRIRSAADRAAFSHELGAAVAALAARYHDPGAVGGRSHRLLVLAHPIAENPTTTEDPTTEERT